MSIKLRFALLLGLFLLTFAGSLALLRHIEQAQLDDTLAASRRDAASLLERWLDLNGASLRQFAEDYSRWDDTVAFMKSRDQVWAEVNLRQSLDTFKAHALWVLSPDGELVYQAGQDESEQPVGLGLSAEEWRQLAASNPFPYFFLRHKGQLLEVRAAPIQPSNDTGRSSPPQGWLVVSRLWDETFLKSLGTLTESRISLDSPAPPDTSPQAEINVNRALNDWRGRTLSLLCVTRELPTITSRLHNDALEARIFLAFGLLVMAALGLSLHAWIFKPLNAIGASLTRQDPAPLRLIVNQDTELGRIARQLKISFAQQDELSREVSERARLGRDLHDGVIQSIYAAGMGLAAARTLMHTRPVEAAQSVDQVRDALNETIRDVRNFITGLEPEALQSHSFTSAVSGVFKLLRTAGPADGDLDIDESAAAQLHLSARTAALQIIRECASNAFRHGHAHHMQVSLRTLTSPRAVRLIVADDGAGFDPATVKRGHGLDNIIERARQLGASAEINSFPGKGTRTTVIFPVTESAT